jgi:hypothetical protein
MNEAQFTQGCIAQGICTFGNINVPHEGEECCFQHRLSVIVQCGELHNGLTGPQKFSGKRITATFAEFSSCNMNVNMHARLWSTFTFQQSSNGISE